MEQPVTLGLPFALNRKVLFVNSKIMLDFVAFSIDFYFWALITLEAKRSREYLTMWEPRLSWEVLEGFKNVSYSYYFLF